MDQITSDLLQLPALAGLDAENTTLPEGSLAVTEAAPAADTQCPPADFWVGAGLKAQLAPVDDCYYPDGVAFAVLFDGASELVRLAVSEDWHRHFAELLGLEFEHYLAQLRDSATRHEVIARVNAVIGTVDLGIRPPELQLDDPQVAKLLDKLVWEYQHHSRRAHHDPHSRQCLLECGYRLEALLRGDLKQAQLAPISFSRDSTLAAQEALHAPTLEEVGPLLDPTAGTIQPLEEGSEASVNTKEFARWQALEKARQRVIRGIRKLWKAKHRELMLCVFDDGMSLADAARHLRIADSTASDRFKKAVELTVRHRLVHIRDLELICDLQERAGMVSAIRLGRSAGGKTWNTPYTHPHAGVSGARGLGDGNFRTPPGSASYSAPAHASRCRCTVCVAMIGNRQPFSRREEREHEARMRELLYAMGYRPRPYREPPFRPLTAEDIAKLRAPIVPSDAMHQCSRKPRPELVTNPAQREAAGYYTRHRHAAIKGGTYGKGKQERKYVGESSKLAEEGFGDIRTGLTSLDKLESALDGAANKEDSRKDGHGG